MPDFKSYWNLDPSIYYLNHGSFGACPKRILERQNYWQTQLERQPVAFLTEALPIHLENARQNLGQFIGASASNLIILVNATTAVNTVLNSLDLDPGDEIILTNHAYPACRLAAEKIALKKGARLVIIEIPFPIKQLSKPFSLEEAVLEQVTEKTRFVMLDHITSISALVFNLDSLCENLRARNIDVLVDGAHAPGMIPLNIDAIKPTYYVGNCHKWLCGPKSAAFLYVDPKAHHQLKPLVWSHVGSSTENSDWRAPFDWMGTWNPSAFLAAVDGIDLFPKLISSTWSSIYQHNHESAIAVQSRLADIFNCEIPLPLNMGEIRIGSMCAMILPARIKNLFSTPDIFTRILRHEHGIEVPVYFHPNGHDWLIRISCPSYFMADDLAPLIDFLSSLLI